MNTRGDVITSINHPQSPASHHSTRDGLEVRLDVALMVAVDRARHARRGLNGCSETKGGREGEEK